MNEDSMKRKEGECKFAPISGYQSRELHLDERKIIHEQKATLDKLTQHEQKRLKDIKDLQLMEL
jgi:hypothetical protein